MIYYTSDTHFSHTRILELCKRPFPDIRKHDEALIRRWNDVVSNDDVVYHLGDFAHATDDEERVRGIFFRLNGRKRLVIGNHDVDGGELNDVLRDLPWNDEPVYSRQVVDGGREIVLCHYPPAEPVAGVLYFYGHWHAQLPMTRHMRGVGVDMPDVGYAPRTLSQLVATMPEV